MGVVDAVSFSTYEAISYLRGTPAEAANEIATATVSGRNAVL